MNFMATIGAIGQAAGLIRLLSEASTEAAVKDSAIELQSILISVQQEVIRMQQANIALKKKLAKSKHKMKQRRRNEKDLQCYELRELAPGVVVFALRPGAQPRYPFPLVCPHCAQKREISPLQRSAKTTRGTTYHCANCGNDIIDHTNANTPVAGSLVKPLSSPL